jgi:hypothetical protein
MPDWGIYVAGVGGIALGWLIGAGMSRRLVNYYRQDAAHWRNMWRRADIMLTNILLPEDDYREGPALRQPRGQHGQS